LDKLIQEIIKIVDAKTAQIQKQSEEKIKKPSTKKSKK
jgi:hypothetical protein